MQATGRYPLRILKEHDFDPGTRLTLITLYSLADGDTYTVWSSAQEIADLSGYALRSIHHHLRKISELGWTRPTTAQDPRGGTFQGLVLLMAMDGQPRLAEEATA